MGSWGEGPRLGLRVERKEAGVGGGLGGGVQDRRRQGLASVVVKRRRPGSPRGWEGRQTRGGCRETQKAPAPPPAQAQREAIGSWGGLGVTADMRRGGLGHREKAVGSQATRVSVPQCLL